VDNLELICCVEDTYIYVKIETIMELDKCKDKNSLYLNPKILKEKRNNSKTF